MSLTRKMLRVSDILPTSRGWGAWKQSGFSKKNEFLAAVIGAILVIPQGITFSYLTGVPPQHGILCAIFVTLLTALWGNSIMMSGPNTATSIVLGMSITPLAVRQSPTFVNYILLLSLMAGFIQFLVWLFRGEKVFNYIKAPAISGVTMAVGVLIMRSSLESISGMKELSLEGFWRRLFFAIENWQDVVSFYSLSVGLITIASGFFFFRKFPKYAIFMCMVVGTAAGFIMEWYWSKSMVGLEFLGKLDFQGVAPRLPDLAVKPEIVLQELVPAAFSVAFISLAQSLVIARDLKLRLDPKLSMSREVFAISFANMVAPLFQAFAGSGSFNRTQANEDMGARTPFAAIAAAIIVLFVIGVMGEMFLYLPMSVVTGVLFIVGFRMIKWEKIQGFAKSKFDLFVFVAVLATVLFVGLIPAIFLAILLTIISSLFLHKVGHK